MGSKEGSDSRRDEAELGDVAPMRGRSDWRRRVGWGYTRRPTMRATVVVMVAVAARGNTRDRKKWGGCSEGGLTVGGMSYTGRLQQ